MFAKTRIRLTLLNAAVFFVILASIGVVVYIDLRNQLYDKVDASIKAKIQGFQVPSAKAGFLFEQLPALPPIDSSSAKFVVSTQAVDPRLFVVFWDEQGNPLPTTPIDAGSDAFFSSFRPYRSTESAATVQIGDHVYRTYSVAL